MGWKIVLIHLTFFFLSACSQNTDFSKGKSIYEQQCQSCHMNDGSGLGTYIPTLDNPNTDFYTQICTIKKGRGDKNLVMPAFDLSPIEFTNLINYLNEQFGNAMVYLPKDFETIDKMCQ
jgi:mono/diheme cytochrome c family protein